MAFYGSKMDAAQFVKEAVDRLESGSLLIMTIRQDRSGDCSVSTAIDMSSEDIVKMLGQACLDQLTNIY